MAKAPHWKQHLIGSLAGQLQLATFLMVFAGFTAASWQQLQIQPALAAITPVQLELSSHGAMGLPIQQLPIAIRDTAGLKRRRVNSRATLGSIPLRRGQGKQAGMGTGSVLLKSHCYRAFGITGLCNGQRLAAALARVQGEGLQRQTA